MWDTISHIDKHPNEETHENIVKLIQERDTVNIMTLLLPRLLA